MRRPNAIPGGGAMPLDREKNAQAAKAKATATSNSSQGKLNAFMKSGSAKVFGTDGNISEQSGTSIFDPVLCELIYRWFTAPSHIIIDPFAGGSVRGIVASKLSRQYIGIDLSERQINANREQGDRICNGDDLPPTWICGDSLNITDICNGTTADFIFSCPPYADLEVYSDDPQDLSTMAYADFITAYRQIITDACSLLADNRFACFVVGEVRDKRGHYYNFVGDTITAFMDAGLSYYNEMILVTCVGSLPIRAGRQFTAGRKIGKTHQNILVFVKGDAKKATEACGIVNVDDCLSQIDIDNDINDTQEASNAL